jgi:formyl-CoA transferase
MTKPLDGVRILAIEQMQALPFATQLLGHLGAEVVKVEHPKTGDSGRGALPAVADTDGRQVGATYLRNNLGKRSIAIDLKHPEGRELIMRLVPRYDVLGENFKPGTMQRLGFGWDVMKQIHPGLIYVSVSGFGNLTESPYASFPAYAPIAEAMGGFYEYKRAPDAPPTIGAAGALGDIGSSLFAAIGLLAALRERDRTGQGRYVDVAMFDAMVAMADMIPFMWSMGVRKGQTGSGAGVLTGFMAKDGYFIVQALREHHLKAFAEAVGHPEWLADERFATRLGWNQHMETVVRPAVETWAANRTKLECARLLCERGVAAGPSNSPEDVIGDPHVRSHNMILEVPRPDADDPLLVVGNPIKFSDMPDEPSLEWPRLGEHTDEVLAADLGLGADEIAGLRSRGAIGPQPSGS